MNLLLLGSLALATVELSTPPVRGEEVLLTVTDELGEPEAGVTVRVVHRAGLAAASEMAIGISDARGEVPWVPVQSGVAEVVAGDEILPVRIAWTHTPSGPVSALVLLLIAALSGLGYGLRRRS